MKFRWVGGPAQCLPYNKPPQMLACMIIITICPFVLECFWPFHILPAHQAALWGAVPMPFHKPPDQKHRHHTVIQSALLYLPSHPFVLQIFQSVRNYGGNPFDYSQNSLWEAPTLSGLFGMILWKWAWGEFQMSSIIWYLKHEKKSLLISSHLCFPSTLCPAFLLLSRRSLPLSGGQR